MFILEPPPSAFQVMYAKSAEQILHSSVSQKPKETRWMAHILHSRAGRIGEGSGVETEGEQTWIAAWPWCMHTNEQNTKGKQTRKQFLPLLLYIMCVTQDMPNDDPAWALFLGQSDPSPQRRHLNSTSMRYHTLHLRRQIAPIKKKLPYLICGVYAFPVGSFILSFPLPLPMCLVCIMNNCSKSISYHSLWEKQKFKKDAGLCHHSVTQCLNHPPCLSRLKAT